MIEVAILIGLQASGKTSFYHAALAATHVHVSKDAFPKARNRQARQRGARVTGYWFPPDSAGSRARNTSRGTETRVPEVGLYATLKRLRQPRLADGFDELFAVRFDGRGGFLVRPMEE
ncbi:ATP-binding protein [Amycolatopsis sp. CA-230715]|uniref:ATP-binding protein n=1 Tax=Amycolatopsis sp. CA-230715 TaxID=2745196 RepID=UPI001C00B663|nr:ATP-binding protein [Amycolatopsis sp. CA-230715]QWF79541.1 hypothetical protein HUW46_02949 [Amycolatopsis sp. CA-230715]